MNKTDMIIFLAGYFQCLDDYGTWNNGVRCIGVMWTPIEEIKERMLLENHLTPEDLKQ